MIEAFSWKVRVECRGKDAEHNGWWSVDVTVEATNSRTAIDLAFDAADEQAQCDVDMRLVSIERIDSVDAMQNDETKGE